MSTPNLNIRIISAGAGSGKTYRLTSEMVDLLKAGVRPSGIIATTFTRKAAAELQERVRVRLLEAGMTREADELTNALIGTVHGLGVKLLHRFAYEAGVSPEVDIIAEEDQQLLFNQSLSTVLTEERVQTMDYLSDRLGLTKREFYDWRREVKNLTDIARANDFSLEVLEQSKERSYISFAEWLGEVSSLSAEDFNARLKTLLEETIERLDANEDTTKKTQSAVDTLRGLLRELRLRGYLYWHQWAKLGKLETGAKSREDIAGLTEFANTHDTHPEFHEDIRRFIYQIFEIAVAAIREYDEYKKRRGLIDYTDMEVLIKRLLDDPGVQAVLTDELDLLMVDEFQDTSPLQLEIFLRLSRFARYSIWVGDPKQSIYGFRGAEPRLMQAIIEQTGGVGEKDIQKYSWRSREDIVFATNAIFTKAFTDLPAGQVALEPKRKGKKDHISLDNALLHWHFVYEGEGRRIPGRPWTENCIAEKLRQLLEGGLYVHPNNEKKPRPARPGDVAILCRSNHECEITAEALARAGFQVATARAGLLATPEAKLVLACLKYILNQYDSLSVAELLLLAGNRSLEEIVEDRLNYLEKQQAGISTPWRWAEDNAFIRRLNELRERVVELSSAEILNLLLSEMDLARIVAAWGNLQQRLDNIDVLRKLALQYEEACNRLHNAASLGGFLLWLNELENEKQDQQGAGRGPDAVEVLTYHKSKGLEWPIVICHSLEGNLRADVWGLEIIAEREDVDLGNVLGHRWLRYWVNPYADQYRNTPLDERLNDSPVKAEKTVQALQEEARLLYVGITRARDYLIFPSTSRPTKWLNRVCNHGDENTPILDPYSKETPWEWNNRFLNIEPEISPFPREFTYAGPDETPVPFIEENAGRQPHPPYRYDLTQESLDDEIQAQAGTPMQYGGGLTLPPEVEVYPAAKMLKAFLTADWPDYPHEDRLAMAQGLIDRYELAEHLDAYDVLRAGDRWQHYLDTHFDIGKTHRKYPVRLFRNDRLFETVIDLVLETPQGLIIIQNSGQEVVQKGWRSKAQALGDWLHLSKTAVQELFDEPRVRMLVHFVLSGALVEVETEEKTQTAKYR